jgi:GR25 family glycosyltransferase involved in LPS biosynthesis
MNPIRNNAFMAINQYKPVDSAGRLFNNVGDLIYAGLGGGGGELKKHEFLKQYRFCIAYENSASAGYTTEKLLHAKAAGCVPIYWGDPKVGREFNEKGFINASQCKSIIELIALVDEIESDPAKWAEIASVPALSSYNRDLVRRTFSEMVRRFFIVAGRNDLTIGLPSFIGAKNSAEADAMRPHVTKVSEPPKLVQAVQAVQPVQATNIQVPFFVTASTQRFWPFLLMWLNSLESHRKAVTSIKARVYVGADVAEAALKMTQDKFAGFAEFIRFPTEAPIDFPDFWHPQHYAWKLWIYNSLVNDPVLKANNQLVFYMDCASVMMRWPTEWIHHTLNNGISFLEDCRQKNRPWCHTYFCQIMEVTDEEKEQQQVLGGILMFIASNERAQEVFTEAYKLAQLRPLIVGDKCEGIGPDGKPFGHRHDQSILSILSSRMGLARFPIDKVYGDKSARTTFHSGQCIYVHRGNFQSHSPIVPGIDDAFVINLDRRDDRKKAFLEEHPDLKGHVRRLPAYDGRKLQLTPSMARLFKTNDFFWKKAVMGCALSHLKLWNMLISEPPEIQSYFIMEDDARLSPGWREAWLKAYPNLPDGWDCVYLGGILPPNRNAFSMTLERVADGLAKVAPNKIFGQAEPNSYFHFCAYAYVLSRRGAEKILGSILEHDGYWTSADHMVCNRIDTMNLYVLDPLVAGASQDNDPIYQNAQFNNFSRVDNFDSDLWNNDERFSESEVLEQLDKGAPLQITASLAEVDTALIQAPAPVAAPAAAPAAASVAAPVAAPVAPLPKHKGPCFVSLDICNLSYSTLYESNWLQDLFQTQQFNIKQVSMYDDLDEYDELIVIIIRPKWQEQTLWLETLRSYGKKFKILHIGDEHSQDPIHMYSWPEVTGVLRFYTRSDLPVDPKIIVLPLGYHAQFKGNRDVPHMSTPDLPFRELMWSFAGTDWHNRCKNLEILNKIEPNFSKWFEDWNDQKQLKDDEYISLLLNSKFIPCPGGQNTETFRFYEALDCGCIPLFIDCPPVLDGKIPFLKMQNWEHAAALMHHFRENIEQMEDYRRAILVSWAKYKMELKEKVRIWLTV